MKHHKISMDRFKNLYPNRPNKQMAEIFGLSTSTVGRIAKSLGLKKDYKYISQIQTQRNHDRWRNNAEQSPR